MDRARRPTGGGRGEIPERRIEVGSLLVGIFGRERMRSRTPEQLALMRAAGLLVARTLDVVRGAVGDGVSTLELDTVAETYIRDHSGVPNFQLVPGYRHTLCTSVNHEIVHGIPSAERVLRDGDLLSVDCGALLDGWNGDAAFSVVVGGPGAARPEDLELIDDTESALWAGIAALAVGDRLYAVGAAVEDSLVAAGRRRGRVYGIVQDYVGHGIGTTMHEDPQVPNYRVPAKGLTVVEGSTVAIEPMVTLGEQENDVLDDEWTVVTRDGARAAHCEHSVAVTSAGIAVLTALDGGASRLASLGVAHAPIG